MPTKEFVKSCIEHNIDPATDLADGYDLIQSRDDPTIFAVAVAIINGKQVCQFCHEPFFEGDPNYSSVEMILEKPDGTSEGTRLKVHGKCQEKHYQKYIENSLRKSGT